jgi:hypothetical protein
MVIIWSSNTARFLALFIGRSSLSCAACLQFDPNKHFRAKLPRPVFHELIKKEKMFFLFSLLILPQINWIRLPPTRRDEEQPGPESVGRAQVPRLVRYLPPGL